MSPRVSTHLRRWGRRLILGASARPQRRLRRYASLDEAARDCDGYQDDELIEVVCRKTEGYRAGLAASELRDRQTIQNLFVLLHVSRREPIDVVELGGACGAVFFEVERWLPGLVRRWTIVETPAMARAARARFADDRLRFADDLSPLDARDGSPSVFMAQGSLPFVPDAGGVLARAARGGFDALYVTRTLVLEDEPAAIVTRQEASIREHGPGPTPADVHDRLLTQPMVLLPWPLLRHPPDGYETALSFEEGPAAEWQVGNGRVRVRERGVLLRRGARP
jgi:putative methyltransferase (TIGR04325 family)